MKYLLIVLLAAQFLFAQALQTLINDDYETLRHTWRASWISHPTASNREYGVFHFRRHFHLDSLPQDMQIFVSADNRYKLFVNGEFVCHGPARSDELHWRYEKVDIQPFLHSGENCIAVLVFNYGKYMPAAQHSVETAFLLQAKDSCFAFLDTDEDWRVLQNLSFSPIPISEDMTHGFYAVSPGDCVEATQFPWGWQQIDFDDRSWPFAAKSSQAVSRGYMHGVDRYLQARTIPLLEVIPEKDAHVVKSSLQHAESFPKKPLHISAHTTASILLDQQHLTLGFPTLIVSGGQNAEIRLTYAEALFDSTGNKGNRSEIKGKSISGVYDLYKPDGAANREFTPLSNRTWRYIQVDVTTQNEPLILENLGAFSVRYPFQQNAAFHAEIPRLHELWTTAWRTARLCALETYYDCPYYEQLQYIGDTRIQALISLYMSGDDRLMRNALQLFDYSRISDGITYSRYPSHTPQFIPPFSLIWVAMVHDFYMHRNDPEFVRSFLPGIHQVLDYFARHTDDENMLNGLQWFNFVDWADQYRWGVPPGVDVGYSALVSLQYVAALQKAGELCKAFDQNCYAQLYAERAAAIQQAIQKKCWNAERGLFADTPEMQNFSQHSNILAVLTDTALPREQKKIMSKVLSDSLLTRCTLSFSFYLFEALHKAGLGYEIVNQLDPWYEMLNYGLTTFGETRIGNTSEIGMRSDCHAWSAHPLYHFIASLCGIRPAAPGFAQVVIRPALGNLSAAQAEMPHPLGLIRFKMDDEHIEIQLPKGLIGTLQLDKKSFVLTGGENKLVR